MSTNKLLTLVIPTYNMEAFLSECLSTLIVGKEYMDLLEVLIVIDGSKDRSAQIGQEFANLYPDTFRVIVKTNGNYGSCVNRGIDEARGKYIKTLDADDKFMTENLSLFLRELRNVETDMIISDYVGWNMLTYHIDHFCYNLPTPGLFGLEEMSRMTFRA
jgi:glycosyltransferase involved in cell wall biosynthesis